MNSPIQSRYDFVYLFDITDGNPNGDPDAGNLPRVDAETGQGLVTDVCLKRKVRNYVGLVHGEQPPYEIYVKEKAILNRQHDRAYKALSLDSKDRKSKGKDKADEDRKLTKWMCGNFYDIRSFGAVMTTEVNCGQVRGPIQFTFARSIDPIISQEHAITRCAVATEREADKQEGDNRTMGRKFTIPYGLYRGFGYINPSLADPEHNGTGFSEDDLALFRKSLNLMFENDRSAARGLMRPVRCIAFRHENKLGNARADQLFARVKVELKEELKAEKRPPRSKDDYKITVAAGDLPEGITVEEWV
ncbi:MAG TPA: type I-C CRISPR-associated protein Cas7/Csd2 [Tepidisphaeraceae bacterium]|nr:type I-C CRISPR-associated protein Cas7/Csd2 [Tepidisphaeraceae bacterium]